MLLWLIFRQLHPNFINVRTAYASEIWAQLTKNHLTKSSTERFRKYIGVQKGRKDMGVEQGQIGKTEEMAEVNKNQDPGAEP